MNSQSTNQSVSLRRSKDEESQVESFGGKGFSWTTIIIILVVLILIAVAVWYFVLRKKQASASSASDN